MSEHYSGNDPARGCGLLLILASALIMLILIGFVVVAILRGGV